MNKNKQSQGIDFGKVPPQSTELEEIIIGTLILEKTAMDRLENILTPEMFYNVHHGNIYKCMVGMNNKQLSIDVFTLQNELTKLGILETIGGGYSLMQLMSKVASSAHLETHAHIIHEKYLKREIIRICSEKVNNAYDDSIDVEDLLSETNIDIEKLNDIAVGNVEDSSMKSIVSNCISSLDERTKNGNDNVNNGISSGLKSLDDIVIGFKGGKLIVVAGRPGMGKTSIALSFAKAASKQNKYALIFSLEMDKIELGDKLIKGESNVDSYRYEKGTLQESEWTALEKNLHKVENMNLIVDDKPRISVRQITSRARRLHKKGKCHMIVIDYLQLINMESKYGESREQQVATTTRELKVLAKELNVPLLLLAQLSRKVEERGGEKRPQLSDLRESGAIEQDADIVLFPYRPEEYGFLNSANEPIVGVGDIMVLKHRGGSKGRSTFYYNQAMTKITDEKQDTDLPF